MREPAEILRGRRPVGLVDSQQHPHDLLTAIRQAISQLKEAAVLLAHAVELLCEGTDPTADDSDVHAAQGVTAGRLSHRELRVASLIAQGQTNKQIGRTLGISLNTVKNHNKRILAKMGLRSRTEVAIALHRVPEQSRGTRAGDA
ncbi:response regulator transcription factor [Streptomyces sp. NPDC059982]|uniref:helix-turn-helix transcriptional regulator n=1 Tax=unclassified Streptomyces TaxID=2593676 RepID=UPI0036AF1A55